MKKICVIGLGYIGLPTAVILASNGWQVHGVDINEELINQLKLGVVYIEEMNLENLAYKVLTDDSFIPGTEVEPADIYIIAVPTPKTGANICDLTYVEEAVKNIMPFLKVGDIIIVESTIPPLTCDEFIKPELEKRGFIVGENIYLAHCPERVLPGKIMYEIIENNRIIGGCTQRCAEKAAEVYSSFVKGEIMLTDAKTAEMTKLMENTFRDVNIALSNEMVKICRALGVNALEVLKIANKHPRVNLHFPGPGVGGHCLAVDPYFIVEKSPELARIISDAREVNCSMPAYIVDRVKDLVGMGEGIKISVLGVSYKGNVADVRESPALDIIASLKKSGYKVSIYDPLVDMEEVEKDISKVIQGADMILILTDHDEFRTFNYEKLIINMKTPIIFDTKSILEVEKYLDTKVCLYNLGNV